MGKINLKRTERGFTIGHFKDLYGEECSIQESSLATKACIWLGMNKTPEPKGPLQEWHGVSPRMHLDQKQAAELVVILQHFVKTGYLPEPKAKPQKSKKAEVTR